ncbi:MAG: hypothetical protein ABSC25_19050 [Roseiarcus sp.]|jgi:hypothetical protein
MDDVEWWRKRQVHLARAKSARKAFARESNFAAREEYRRVCDEEEQAAWAAYFEWEIRFTGRIVATPCYCGREGWEVWWKPDGLKLGPFAAEARHYALSAEAVMAATPILQRRFPRATLAFGRPRRFSRIRWSRSLFAIEHMASPLFLLLNPLVAAGLGGLIALKIWPSSLLAALLAAIVMAALSAWVLFRNF